ncbi:SDR family NAD(P)-dependent oxidoreductase [Pontixanthobacter gangjinensis]|uniref:SDR family NAD(P)-dependent oxidoreductase n=1 Tax=Pontixanthobacter gangjinensis TaxID=1028742 RepID=A0A6I4SN40_9SPHN|nr:SDR family oxidoreductase [Pontixanthobacter gangjinensis]MXO56566.1 SDR family NAD(P)-dependent oxidoreductase [Pontixanthobacter gangjinensis]
MSETADWSPKSAVITGGASGIGLAIARELSSLGCRIMVADFGSERLDTAIAELSRQGAECVGHACDVSDLKQVDALADAAFAQFAQVDLLINNAGVSGPHGKLAEIDIEEARRHFDVNFWGVWHGCRSFAPRMSEQGDRCAIYNTASENALFCAMPKSAAYIAAKHAVLGLTENFREEMPAHVHVGTIIPGWVHTAIGAEQFMKWGMDGSEYAKIVVPQILARERFVVSHSYNAVRKAERDNALSDSFARNAPRKDGDEQFDVRLVIEKLAPPNG